MNSEENIVHLSARIAQWADPLGNTLGPTQKANIQEGVRRFVSAWKQLGKFEEKTLFIRGVRVAADSIAPATLLELYNQEFVSAFADKLVSITDVPASVNNPDGLCAQQTRIVFATSLRPVPASQRSVFRRLNDRNLERPIDEMEAPFYRMDKNPRMPESERAKQGRPKDHKKQPSPLEREGLAFRAPKFGG